MGLTDGPNQYAMVDLVWIREWLKWEFFIV